MNRENKTTEAVQTNFILNYSSNTYRKREVDSQCFIYNFSGPSRDIEYDQTILSDITGCPLKLTSYTGIECENNVKWSRSAIYFSEFLFSSVCT